MEQDCTWPQLLLTNGQDVQDTADVCQALICKALICKKNLKSPLFSTTISEFKPILTFSAILRRNRHDVTVSSGCKMSNTPSTISGLTFTATKWGDQSRNPYDVWLQTNVQWSEKQRFCFPGSDYCVKLLRYVSLKSLTVDEVTINGHRKIFS